MSFTKRHDAILVALASALSPHDANKWSQRAACAPLLLRIWPRRLIRLDVDVLDRRLDLHDDLLEPVHLIPDRRRDALAVIPESCV